MDLDTAARELLRRVVAESGWDLRQDLRRGVDEHPALRNAAEARIPAQRVVGEVGQLRERLDAGVAGADEDEAEMGASLACVELRVRRLELAQHAVAEHDRIGQVLEAEAVLGEAGEGKTRGTAPSASTRCSQPMSNAPASASPRGPPALLVDLGHTAEHQLGTRAHLTERDDGVPRLERARGGLGQHRRVEHEVLRADDRRPLLAEQARDVAAGEAAADHETPPRA